MIFIFQAGVMEFIPVKRLFLPDIGTYIVEG